MTEILLHNRFCGAFKRCVGKASALDHYSAEDECSLFLSAVFHLMAASMAVWGPTHKLHKPDVSLLKQTIKRSERHEQLCKRLTQTHSSTSLIFPVFCTLSRIFTRVCVFVCVLYLVIYSFLAAGR